MNVYKVIFVQNGINSCQKPTASASTYKTYHYELSHGKLIYAIIKDETEANARSVALNIINEINKSTEKIVGAQ